MKKVILAVVFGLLAGSACVFGADYSAVIEERQEVMKANRQAQKALKSAASNGDLAAVEKEANKLENNFDKLADPALFPKGSSSQKSRARTLVWENREEFMQEAKNAATIARAITAEAKAGQLQQVRASVSSLGKRTCTSCHKTFRKPKAKKGKGSR